MSVKKYDYMLNKVKIVDLVLGNTSNTAHRGDHGEEAYAHSQTLSGNPHDLNSSDIGAVDSQEFGIHGVVNRSQTSIAFDPATYTFSLISTGDNWSYYRNGVKHTINGNKTLVLAGTPPNAAQYYIFIDDTEGTLSSSTTPWTLVDGKVPIAILVWNNALTPKYKLADERHDVTWNKNAHAYEHLTFGTRMQQRGAIANYQVAQSSPVDLHNTYSITETKIRDEDIPHTLGALSVGGPYHITYRTAVETWEWIEQAIPFKYGTYIQYDNAGVMTDLVSNKYVNTFIAATNCNGNCRFNVIHGQAQHNNITSAQSENWSDLLLNGIELPEAVAVYKIIWHTGNSYNTTGKCRMAAEPIPITGNLVNASSTPGLGTMSTQNADDVNITGGTFAGVTFTDYPLLPEAAPTEARQAVSKSFVEARGYGLTTDPATMSSAHDGAILVAHVTEADPNAVLLAHFNDLTDATGRHTLTAVGSPTFDALENDPFGLAAPSLVLDGASYLSTPDSDDWTPETNWTAEMWVRPSVYGVLFSHGQSNNANFGAGISGVNGLSFGYHNTSGVPINFSQGNTAGWSMNAWHHVAFVKEGTNYRGYLNGVKVIDATNTTAITNYASPLWIGVGYWSGPSGYFTGRLAEFRWQQGVATYEANFTPPTSRHSVASSKRYDIGADKVTSLVSTAGDQTVSGIKTFSSYPLLPEAAPTGDREAVPKDYLGTAATLDVGTAADNIVQLDGDAKLPAVDGSQLTNLPGGGGGGPATLEIINADLTDSKYTFASRVTILNIYSNTGDVVLADITTTSESTVIDFSHVAPLTGTWVIEYFSTLNTANIVTDDTLTGSGTAADPLEVVPMASPICINMVTTAPSAVGQGTWIKQLSSAYPFAALFINDTGATGNGDNFSVSFACPAGKYRLDINTVKNAARGILDVFLDDGKIIDAADLYASTQNTLVDISAENVEIETGTHSLKFVVNGKNASSTGYYLSFSGISITRTGDIV